MKRRKIFAALGASALVAFALIVGFGGRLQSPSSAPSAQPRALAARSAAPFDATHARLPDLDQEIPTDLQIRRGLGGRGYRIGFRSAVRNVGDGPLIVKGTRPDTRTPTMTVAQIVARTIGPPAVIPDVGRMQFAISPDHSHWHYLQFDRYELQRSELHPVKGGPTLVADRKSGFCLGDRYRMRGYVPRNSPPRPVYTGRCGLARRELLQMREGISVGYGDDYKAFLEGQDLPLDGLADGRYVLVHRVNGDERLQEVSYANNAASLLLELHWDKDIPRVRIVASCPDTDRCGQRAP